MNIEKMIKKAAADGASDIHLVCGATPRYRLDGQLQPMMTVSLSKEMCEAYGRELADDSYESIKTIGELDMAKTIAGVRVRMNIFRQQGCLSIALRLLNKAIPRIKDLGLPPIVSQFPLLNKGIVLVTGETGSGKSTTLAAVLNEINHMKRAHIITLEDPIEYIYTPAQCVINQREIGVDTRSYADGLRAVLREDPDVILIGEMRDRNTVETALRAAETGHLVFATLHTNSAPDTIDRIVGIFPPESQAQVRMELSLCLKAVVSQQLLPRKTGKGRVAACEVMVVNQAIKHLIREGKTPQMFSAMLSGRAEGSITMDNRLIEMVREQLISMDTAREAAHDRDYVKRSFG